MASKSFPSALRLVPLPSSVNEAISHAGVVAKCEERKIVEQRLQKLKDQGSEAESKQEMKNSRIYPEERNSSLSVYK